MISNYISYAISLIEILFIGGAVWGWGFMQYMFEKEYVFYDSQCFDDCLDACLPENTSKCILRLIQQFRIMLGSVFAWLVLIMNLSMH